MGQGCAPSEWPQDGSYSLEATLHVHKCSLDTECLKENFVLFYLLIKGTWQGLLPGSESPSRGWGAPKDSSMRGAAERPCPQNSGALRLWDWPRPSGHMEAPPPDVPGLGFPALGAGGHTKMVFMARP